MCADGRKTNRIRLGEDTMALRQLVHMGHHALYLVIVSPGDGVFGIYDHGRFIRRFPVLSKKVLPTSALAISMFSYV